MNQFILMLGIFTTCHCAAQDTLRGKVLEIENNIENSIPGVSVYGNKSENATITDINGFFEIPFAGEYDQLIFSVAGFQNDTINIDAMKNFKIILRKTKVLKEVEVSGKREAIGISTIRTINVETITQKELLKAACCNLSEAFESNPSVNVSYKDAVTGVKEIQLLGLGGTYVQVLNENTPDMRGLAGIYGLTYIPGPWIESIQVTKGAGSVINGYESVTGQLNIEYKKPFNIETPHLFLNLFSDEKAGAEANIIYTKKLSAETATTLFLHGKNLSDQSDRNHDGFKDVPGDRQINMYNRWEFRKENKLEAQAGFKFVTDEVNGGQVNDVPNMPAYKTNVKTTRAEVSGKLGFIFPEKPQKSIGNIFTASVHNMNSYFGLKHYDANEKTVYFQSIYQNDFGKLNHKYTAGFSFRYNSFKEELITRVVTEELIPGIFFEYTYNYSDKLTLVAGIREDILKGDKFIFTPRFHMKYNFNEDFVLRISSGKGYRTPYIIADHLSVLASSREIIIQENIHPENAWNYGINLTKKFHRNDHDATLSIDFYRTDFINQLVMDTYSDSSAVLFYNLKGKSFSNSLQFTVNTEVFEGLDLRLAYKLEDVKSTYSGVTETVPLSPRQRSLASLSYITSNAHWKFDYTFILEGKKKLQFVYSEDGKNKNEYSPSFSVMNFQVTKVFKRFEIYGGGENVLDFRQPDPIVNPENPFGNSFDATNIWGPVAGRRLYAGIRISFK